MQPTCAWMQLHYCFSFKWKLCEMDVKSKLQKRNGHTSKFSLIFFLMYAGVFYPVFLWCKFQWHTIIMCLKPVNVIKTNHHIRPVTVVHWKIDVIRRSSTVHIQNGTTLKQYDTLLLRTKRKRNEKWGKTTDLYRGNEIHFREKASRSVGLYYKCSI